MSIDNHDENANGLESPPRRWKNITLGATELDDISTCIGCAVSGTVVIRGVDDSVDTTIYVAAGALHPARAQYIKTGGTATGVYIGY